LLIVTWKLARGIPLVAHHKLQIPLASANTRCN
jgi:hypothetical protein